MLNRVLLIGRLTRDPEIRDLANSKAAIFTIAVNRNYKDRNGQWVEETSFFDVECFSALVEKISTFKKGYQIFLEGELRQDRWEAPSGEKRSKIKIVAEKATLISKPASSTNAPSETKEEEEETVPW